MIMAFEGNRLRGPPNPMGYCSFWVMRGMGSDRLDCILMKTRHKRSSWSLPAVLAFRNFFRWTNACCVDSNSLSI